MRRSAWLAALYAGLALITVAPLALVENPGLGDYTNNLARIHILLQLPHSPLLQRTFLPGWQLAPYNGMDLPVALLAQLIPLTAAGRVFAALCLLMPVAAAAALRWAAWGRIGAAPAAMFMFSYNLVFAHGFLTYLFGAALAAMLFALWLAVARAPRLWHVPIFMLGTVLLCLTHLFAFLAYTLMVAGFEIAAILPSPRPTLPAILHRWASAAATALPALVMAGSLHRSLSTGGATAFEYGPIFVKLGAALSPFIFPTGASGITAALLLLAGLVAAWVQRRDLTRLWHAGAAGALAMIVLAGASVPSVFLNVALADFRLPLLAAILAIGALRPTPAVRPAAAAGLVTALLAITAARSASAAHLFQRADAVASQLRAVLGPLPEGARLLVVQETGPDAPLDMMISHLPLLAAIDHDALVPYQFNYDVPLRLRPDTAFRHTPNGSPITLEKLRNGMAPLPPGAPIPPDRYGSQQYWRGWPAVFDNVLIMHAGTPAPTDLPGPLRHISGNAVADLYAVSPPPP